MVDLTPVFQAIIALLAALVTYKVIPWLRSKTTSQQQENIKAAAHIAVYAAEQIYGAGKGDEKLRYALEKLEEMGFHLDGGVARAAIEEAVYQIVPNYKIYNEALADDIEAAE